MTGVVARPAPSLPAASGDRPRSDLGPRSPMRVLVVASYPAVRAGLAALLARDRALQPVESMQSGRQGLDWAVAADACEVDAIVVDLTGAVDPDVEELSERFPGVPLVMLGASPRDVGPGIGAGPAAYLGSDADGQVLTAAVQAVVQGLTVLDPALAVAAGIHARPLDGDGATGTDAGEGEPLTARERQVLRLVADGLPNKTIARELGISEHTAKFHVGSLLAKLGAASRTEAVTLATRRGLLAI